jgi:hypothetical protein
LEIGRLLRNMNKSFDDYPTLPHIDTDDIDDEDVVDRVQEEQRFRQMYKKMIVDQRKIIKELIRVRGSTSCVSFIYVCQLRL